MGTVRRTLRQSRKRPASSPAMKFVKRSFAVCSIVLFSGIIAGGLFMAKRVRDVEPLVDDIGNHLKEYNSKPSIIYSANHVKIFEIRPIYKEPVSVSNLPKHVIQAVLAAEDKRFYEHPGVDYMGLGRVARNVFTKSDNTGGGSTITMQLAKKLFSASEKKIGRKFQDIAIAIQLEKRYTKDQILELYVNQIYYGEQAYGLNAAANIYFGKQAEDLDLAEAAMIARCIRTPSKENPVKNYQLAEANKIVVLDIMKGEGWITEKEYEKAKNETPKVKGLSHQSFAKTFMAPYYVAAVRRELERQGINISEGGYSITTTLDTELQKGAEEAIRQEIRSNGSYGVNVGAFICMDGQGRILADVGGRDFAKNQFSYTTQSALQPGSSFKSFIYSEALKENIIGESSEISNEKYTYGKGRDAYTPRNHGGFGGTVDLFSAFVHSINIPAVRTFDKLGIGSGVDNIVKDFGFTSKIKKFPSTALGGSEVKMQEMLEAYSVFMLEGKRVSPYRIKEISGPNGDLIFQGKMDFVSTRIGPDVCQVMDKMMRGVVTSGTGKNAGTCPDAHGKTGTTNDGKSGWFCGYAKGIVGIAWAGRELYNKKRKAWYLQPLAEFGGDVAAPFWGRIMNDATQKFGSDIKPDFSVQSGDEEPRKRRRRAESDPNSVNIVTSQDDKVSSPTEPDNSTGQPAQNDGEPAKNDNGDDPLKDTTSDPASKTEKPVHEPKKPKDDIPKDEKPKEERPKSDKPKKPVEGEMTEVEVCADSGLIATRYCPETINKRLPKNKRPKRRCGLHKAPNEGGDG